MLSFREFLVEAEIAQADLERVLSIFQKRLPRALGAKVYRYGGSDYVESVGGGQRITYIFGTKAYGVRYKGGRVTGIDVWPKFGIGYAPEYFINISKLSADTLIGAIAKLAQIIKSPKEGDMQLKEDMLSEMASRVSPDDFYSALKKEYGADKARELSWGQIQDIADDNDWQIPGYIKGQKIEGTRRFDGKPGGGGGSSSGGSGKDDSERIELRAGGETLVIRVSKLDPESKSLMPAGDNAAAKALYKQIRSFSNPDAKPSEEEMRNVDTLYGHLAQLVSLACKGDLKSLLIYGGPGTGKTFTIMKTVKDMGMESGKDYVKLSGKASPIKIYETLYMYRDNGMVIFDDLDSMWRNEEATNILKAALDTSPVREISWDSANTQNITKLSKDAQKNYMDRLDKQIAGETVPLPEPVEDDEDDEDEDDEDAPKKKKKPARALPSKPLKFPSTFEFTGRVVFISNLKKEEFDSAIMSRSAKIDMSMSAEEILKRMRGVLANLGGDDVSVEKKNELLDALLEMNQTGELDQVTMREFVKGMNILRSGVPNWKELLRYA